MQWITEFSVIPQAMSIPNHALGGIVPRLNVEDSLYSDRRWSKLVIKVGCHYTAKGMLIEAWTLAQKNWLKHGAIPKKGWPKELNVLIDLEFAEEIEREAAKYIYVKGSQKHFSWLEQKSAAGKKGGKTSKKPNVAIKKPKKKSTINKLESVNHVIDPVNQKQACANGSNPLSLSLTPSLLNKKDSTNVESDEPSSSTTSKKASSKKKTSKKAKKKTPSVKEDNLNKATNRVVAYYCDLWKYKHGRSPSVKGRDVGLLKTLTKDLGPNRVADLLKGFFTIPDSMFVFRGYSVTVFNSNIERIDAFLATGTVITKTKSIQVDNEIENSQSIMNWEPPEDRTALLESPK